MADLAIKVNASGDYEDGDILFAHNDSWAFTDTELKHFLVLRVDTNDITTLTDELNEVSDGELVTLKLRRYYVNWRSLDGINENDVEDQDVAVDIRSTTYPSSIIQDKGE